MSQLCFYSFFSCLFPCSPSICTSFLTTAAGATESTSGHPQLIQKVSVVCQRLTSEISEMNEQICAVCYITAVTRCTSTKKLIHQTTFCSKTSYNRISKLPVLKWKRLEHWMETQNYFKKYSTMKRYDRKTTSTKIKSIKLILFFKTLNVLLENIRPTSTAFVLVCLSDLEKYWNFVTFSFSSNYSVGFVFLSKIILIIYGKQKKATVGPLLNPKDSQEIP